MELKNDFKTRRLFGKSKLINMFNDQVRVVEGYEELTGSLLSALKSEQSVNSENWDIVKTCINVINKMEVSEDEIT
jgi:hypothetical protein